MMMPVYFGRMGLLIMNVVMESEVSTIMYFQCAQMPEGINVVVYMDTVPKGN